MGLQLVLWALAGLQIERGHSPEEEHTLLKSQEEGDKKGEQETRREAGALRCRGGHGRRAGGRPAWCPRCASPRALPTDPPGRCLLAARTPRGTDHTVHTGLSSLTHTRMAFFLFLTQESDPAAKAFAGLTHTPGPAARGGRRQRATRTFRRQR